MRADGQTGGVARLLGRNTDFGRYGMGPEGNPSPLDKALKSATRAKDVRYVARGAQYRRSS